MRATPGPWHVITNAGLTKIKDQNNTGLAFVYQNGSEINEANAHLIAAAPDLLSSLEELLCSIYDNDDHLHPDTDEVLPDIKKCEEAIAKARGEPCDQ